MRQIAWLLPIALVTGCASWTGLDAKSSFSCKAPDGILCESMSGVYANAQQSNLPGQRGYVREEAASKTEVSRAKEPEAVLTRPLYSGSPIRTAPRILRVWFAPWEDNDGDLHDQSYVYLPVDAGRWQIEHNRRRIADTYRPVRAPVNAKTTATKQQGAATPPGAIRPQAVQQQGMENIGVNQGRPIGEQAAELINGILGPSGVLNKAE